MCRGGLCGGRREACRRRPAPCTSAAWRPGVTRRRHPRNRGVRLWISDPTNYPVLTAADRRRLAFGAKDKRNRTRADQDAAWEDLAGVEILTRTATTSGRKPRLADRSRRGGGGAPEPGGMTGCSLVMAALFAGAAFRPLPSLAAPGLLPGRTRQRRGRRDPSRRLPPGAPPDRAGRGPSAASTRWGRLRWASPGGVAWAPAPHPARWRPPSSWTTSAPRTWSGGRSTSGSSTRCSAQLPRGGSWRLIAARDRRLVHRPSPPAGQSPRAAGHRLTWWRPPPGRFPSDPYPPLSGTCDSRALEAILRPVAFPEPLRTGAGGCLQASRGVQGLSSTAKEVS